MSKTARTAVPIRRWIGSGTFFLRIRQQAQFATGIVRTGAAVQFVTGLALAGVRHAADLDVNYARVLIKLGIGLAVLISAVAATRRTPTSNPCSTPPAAWPPATS
ncbi:hypothetical protein [Catenuloplanes indicus]|uniref:Uncharacterized protein n=1 Tax=Catenuloplanes indicus TaxID=137267 RepID=A0AAE3VZJ9_9ACTN|nr:hypothetical protein [Catenuloplanes indicus]MDQ0366654.1 hypothetical protein [Catenuloplanes indicus]